MSPAERLEAASIPEPNSGCFLWLGPTFGNGYGAMGFDGKSRGAHVCAWILRHGREVPKGKMVCHKCDMPLCVNADHLFLGSPADNMTDKQRKGRAFRPEGRKHPAARLNEENVRQIRAHTGNAREIGASYGISTSTVTAIKRRERWKHVV